MNNPSLSPVQSRVRAIASILIDLSVALYLGGIAVTAIAAATIFKQAPSRSIAGDIASQMFENLEGLWLGAAGILALAWAVWMVTLRGAMARRGLVVLLSILVAVIVIAVFYAQFVVSDDMAAILDVHERLPQGGFSDSTVQERFDVLHVASENAFKLVLVCSLVLMVLKRCVIRSELESIEP